MESGDLFIANLECALSDRGDPKPFKWATLRASPTVPRLLRRLDVAVLANNHVSDFGEIGVLDTIETLKRCGIQPVGYGANLVEAARPAVVEKSGVRLAIAAQCCPTTNGENLATHQTPGVAPLGMATLKQAIEGARLQCDALIIYLHWGCEWVHDPAPDQLRLARYAIECGADAVVGCHSHTIQSYEQYRGRWIFYGLGNYLFKAGHAQAMRENGDIEHIPLKLDPENRESLAVSFRVVPDRGGGRLMLDRIQPMYFGDDLATRPIRVSDLTFDIEAANARLRAYVAQNDVALSDRSEPVFYARLRNGVLAYWYSEESINPPPKESFKSLIGKMVRRLKKMLKEMAAGNVQVEGPRA